MMGIVVQQMPQVLHPCSKELITACIGYQAVSHLLLTRSSSAELQKQKPNTQNHGVGRDHDMFRPFPLLQMFKLS